MSGELEKKVVESLKEGYSPEEVVKAMKADGYSDQNINEAVTQAQRKLQSSQQQTPSENNRETAQNQGIGQELDSSQQPEMNNTEKSNEDNFALIMALSFFFPPAAYYMLGRTKTALLNVFTLNFLFFGIIIAPIHCYQIMK